MKNKKEFFFAIFGANIVYAFLTIEIDAFLLAIAYLLLEGILRDIAFVLIGFVTFVFFLQFAYHAYLVEMEQQSSEEREDGG